MHPIPPVTKALMLVCIGFFCVGVLWPALTFWLALWPLQSGAFYPWQLLSYAFLHGSFGHLFFNMLGLYMFGSELERHLGRQRYMALLVAGALTAAAVQLLVGLASGYPSPTVGISGAVFGLLLVMAMDFGEQVIMPIIPPIPMKMKVWVALFGGLELVLGYTGGTGVAHFAHLGGMVGAFALVHYWRWQAARRRNSKLRKLH